MPLDKISQEGLAEITADGAFNERSEIAQEIISRRPDFYEKWALIIFLILLLLLATGTWFIKYPDTIAASAILTGYKSPKEIVPQQSGRLVELFVNNNQKVTQGEMLGWIESTADTKEVIDLQRQLDSCTAKLDSKDPRGIAQLLDRKFNRLGELQAAYQTFIKAWLEYKDYAVNGFYARRKSLLQNDIASLHMVQAHLAVQKKLTFDDNILANASLDMNKRLFDEKVISAEEYRKAQNIQLNKQLSMAQAEANIISQQNQIRDKQKEIDQLDHNIQQQQQTFEQELQSLKSNVVTWIRQYTIQAPIDGVVVFALHLQQNQHLLQGKTLGYVNPVDTKYYAEVRLSQSNFGKVDTGMNVLLRFHAYPFQENGAIPGTVSYLSNMAVDSIFLGTVRLDQGLVSNQQKIIPYQNGLKADALIITKDMRLLERLYYSVIKVTSME